MGPLRWRRASSYSHPWHRPGRGLLAGKASTGKVGDLQVAWVEMWVHTRFSFPCSPCRMQCHQRPAQSVNSGWEGRRRARHEGCEVQLSPVPPSSAPPHLTAARLALPWLLGSPAGRWLLRAAPGGPAWGAEGACGKQGRWREGAEDRPRAPCKLSPHQNQPGSPPCLFAQLL